MRRCILQGDAVEQLKTLPDASIDCCCTSPPYWALRDYGTPGQLGLEPSWREHMQALKRVFAEVHRVLKPTGNLWVNYGDTVSAATVGSRDAGSWIGKGRASEGAHPANAPNRLSREDPRKHKLGLAWRLRFMLNDELGFISRSDVVWHKPNSMPLSMKDRVTPKYEMLFHLVKKPRYYFDLNAIRKPYQSTEEHESGDARLARGAKKTAAPGQKPDSIQRAAFNVRVRDAHRGVSDMKWGSLHGAGATPAELARESAKKTPRDEDRDATTTLNGGGWSNAKPARKKTLGKDGTPNSPGASVPPEMGEDGGPDENGQYNGLGANPGDVWWLDEENDALGSETWTIPNQPFADAHFATYPEELVRRVLLASCPRQICTACGEPTRAVYEAEIVDERGRPRSEGARAKAATAAGSHRTPGADHAGTGRSVRRVKGHTACECGAAFAPGVVLDPFAGSFTTCLVAAKMALGFVGIELNEAYVQMGRKRLAPYMRPLDSFAEADS